MRTKIPGKDEEAPFAFVCFEDPSDKEYGPKCALNAVQNENDKEYEATNFTSKRLYPNNKENLKRRENKTDSRTQRRDATSTSRTSQRTPLRSNSRPTSRSTVKSKASSSITKKVLQFMPSFATKTQKVQLMPSNKALHKP